MSYHFNFSDVPIVPITSIALATAGICFYWLLYASRSFKKACYQKTPGDDGIIRHILLLKYAGLLLLGIVPACLFIAIVPSYHLKSLGISFNQDTVLQSFGWIITLGVPIVLVMQFAARRPKTFSQYPQIRVQFWDISLMIRYCAGWIIYMLGYEMLFRGLLLFPLANSLGVWLAIAINTTLYVASHLPKGPDETIAAMFFGPLLCIISLQTETIWAAWIIHSLLAVSNSLIALKHHPDFVIVRNRKPYVEQCEMGCDC